VRLLTLLRIVGVVFSVLWFVDAVFLGGGFISRYLAPLAFGPLLAATWIELRAQRRADRERASGPR